MTDSEKVEFLKYGCLSKAIIKACDAKISDDDFCAKYSGWFNPMFYGMPRGDKIKLIIQDFGFKIAADEWSFDAVRDAFNEGKQVITSSHTMLTEGDDGELNHATVLHCISDSGFQVWSYFQNGSDGLVPAFPKSWWTMKKFHGLILAPMGVPPNTIPD